MFGLLKFQCHIIIITQHEYSSLHTVFIITTIIVIEEQCQY